MKRIAISLFATAMIATAASTTYANELECFPACQEAVKPSEQKCDAASETTKSTTRGAVEKIESINNQIKPVKEVVGYIRSPQGLAVKLVNDHVVKIPAWVGYAIDPVGSIKSRAMGEARDRLKTSIKAGVAEAGACKVNTVEPVKTETTTTEPISQATLS